MDRAINSTAGNMTATAIESSATTEAALTWSTQFAYLAILVAFMQGTLALESADPCRMSFVKYQLFLVLEALEIIVVLLSEGSSFFELSKALQDAMQWLQWLPGCILFVGLMELLLDVWFSLRLASASRVGWIPFSVAGFENGKRKQKQVLLEIIPLILTCISSAVLIGWRQNMWFRVVLVDSDTASIALRNSRPLSALSLGIAIAIGIFFTMIASGYAIHVERKNSKNGTDFFAFFDSPLHQIKDSKNIHRKCFLIVNLLKSWFQHTSLSIVQNLRGRRCRMRMISKGI